MEILDLPNTHISQGSSNVCDEALLEVVSIVTLQGEFVVVGDGDSHDGRET